ncbi:MAG: carotenoid biosynthesis protein [Acidobacteriota bacterium]
MLRTLELLLGTVALRPYVFVFFGCYLFLAITHIGYRRTLLFTVIAYLVAFVCEWSSAVAGTGFPFGLYRYIDTTRDQELWILGVPFMDSLSFTFLTYVSWEMATLCLGRARIGWRDAQLEWDESRRRSLPVSLLAALFMMFLDIVIDPLALRGDRWFLGKIYYYPDGGLYFGVTLANFLGWFIVCFVILRLYFLLERKVFGGILTRGAVGYRFKALGPVGLYFGVLGFNLFMTFWIGELLLGVVDSFVICALAVLVAVALARGGFGEGMDRMPMSD